LLFEVAPVIEWSLGGWESIAIAIVLVALAALVIIRLKNFIINSILGVAALFVLKLMGFKIALTLLNIVLVGLLGLVGLALLIILGLLGVSL